MKVFIPVSPENVILLLRHLRNKVVESLVPEEGGRDWGGGGAGIKDDSWVSVFGSGADNITFTEKQNSQK